MRRLSTFVLAAIALGAAAACSGDSSSATTTAVSSLTGSTPPAASAAPAAKVATVISVTGTFEQDGRALAVGDEVRLDAPFTTVSGTAVISIAGVGEVRIYPKTKLQLTGKSRLKLWAGKLFALVTPQDDSFDVETDNAVAGVRGTQFVVSRLAEVTRVAVVEGKVAVQSRARPEAQVLVPAGQQTAVTGDTAPSAPTSIDSKPEQQSWEEAVKTGDAREPPGGDAGGEQAPGAPGTTPKIEVDRKAFEPHEQQGKAQREALERETAAQKQQLDREEQEQRQSQKKDQAGVEKDLENDVGMKKSAPPQETLKPEKTAPSKQEKDEVKDFLQ